MVAERKKVLIMLANLAGGGAERTVVRLLENLDREKFDPRVVIVWNEGAFLDRVRPEELIVTDVPKLGSTSNPRMIYDILVAHNRVIKDFQPHVILSLTVSMNIAANLALAIYGRKRIGWVLREGNNTLRMLQDDVTNPILAWMRRVITKATYTRADKVLAISNGLGKGLVSNFQVEPERVEVIYNPVETDEVERAPSEAPVLLAIGRLVYQKGFDVLLEAFAGLSDTRSKLIILGEGKDRDALEAQVEQLGLNGRVEMPGFVPNVSDYYKRATAFVLSSRWEGFGCVVIEAMAAGLPVVVTDCDYGPPEIVTHESNGLVVQHSSVPALRTGLQRILDEPKLAAELGLAAKQRARDFSIEKVTRQYEELLLSVVKR